MRSLSSSMRSMRMSRTDSANHCKLWARSIAASTQVTAVTLSPPEVDAALLPGEAVPLEHAADFQVGVVIGVAVVGPELFDVHVEGDGVHATSLAGLAGQPLADLRLDLPDGACAH